MTIREIDEGGEEGASGKSKGGEEEEEEEGERNTADIRQERMRSNLLIYNILTSDKTLTCERK